MEFDGDGMNRLVLRYLDEQLRPAVHKSRGYHQVRTGFDANGNLATIQYLGILATIRGKQPPRRTRIAWL